MDQKIKGYRMAVVILMLIIAVLAIYSSSEHKSESTSLNDQDTKNKKLIDSLERVNKELVGVIMKQRQEEAEAYNKFRMETERLKKEYDEKLINLSNLGIDDHIRFLSDELSKED